MSAANLQNSIQKLADDVQAEVKRTTPKVRHIIGLGKLPIDVETLYTLP